MSKKEVSYIESTCDCCKKTSKEETFLHLLTLPCQNYSPSSFQGFWDDEGISTVKVEVCDDCLEMIHKAIRKIVEINDYDYAGLRVTLHSDIDEEKDE